MATIKAQVKWQIKIKITTQILLRYKTIPPKNGFVNFLFNIFCESKNLDQSRETLCPLK